jgi:cobalt/nickel transport system permease protein
MHTWDAPATSRHFLSRVDTRSQLFCALVAIMLLISQDGLLFPAVVFLASSGAVMGIGIRLRVYLLRLAEPLMIGLVLLAVKSLSGQEALASWQVVSWPVTVYQDGLLAGCALALRIAAAVSALLLLAFACSFTDLLAALSWYRIPRGLIEILLFAHRSLTAVHEEASTIYQAQRNRLGYSSARQGFRSLGILAGTLTVRAFDASQTTALAMMQRGYTGHLPLGECRKLRTADVCSSLLFTLLMGLLWIAISGI